MHLVVQLCLQVHQNNMPSIFSVPDAASVLDSTASVLYDYKDRMGNVAISRCQENEIRELHHWAVQSLRNVQRVGSVVFHLNRLTSCPRKKFLVVTLIFESDGFRRC